MTDDEALEQVAPSDARQTLLRALDHLDRISDESDDGEGDDGDQA